MYLCDNFYESLASHLLAQGKLTQVDLARVQRLMEQIEGGMLPALLMKDQAGGDGLPELLIRLGICSDRDIAQAIAEVSGLDVVKKEEYPFDPPLGDAVSIRFFKEYKLVVLESNDDELVVAVVDPAKRLALDALSIVFDKSIKLKIGIFTEIDSALEKQFNSEKDIKELVEGLEDNNPEEEDIEYLKDMASEAPVIRIVNLIMQKAVEYRASDIHVEPFEQRLIVRLRIDGVLRELDAPPVSSTAAVISRIKIMAKLNIAERRLPQDGRIKLQIQGKEFDMRVSTLPTMYGESVVIRLLNKESIIFDFESLGFSKDILKNFLKVLALPHGIILITGPTGSGKTTTLYTAINHLNTRETKIITVEDPVEYQLEGVNQVQVHPKIGFDFPVALRSIVRQDPDIIMIGEMRDRETASIAIQSALTGHLVLSTLHTNDAASGVTRLLDMGLDNYLLTSTLNGILAQRLVRKLCAYCRRPILVTHELIDELGLKRLQPEGNIYLFDSDGCEKCSHLGYQGRSMIVEFMTFSDNLKRLIMQGSDASTLQKEAIREGMITLYEDGLRKALAGITSFEEVLRVTTDQ